MMAPSTKFTPTRSCNSRALAGEMALASTKTPVNCAAITSSAKASAACGGQIDTIMSTPATSSARLEQAMKPAPRARASVASLRHAGR